MAVGNRTNDGIIYVIWLANKINTHSGPRISADFHKYPRIQIRDQSVPYPIADPRVMPIRTSP
jgi:hypothetical protein